MVKLNFDQLKYRMNQLEDYVFTDHFQEDFENSERFSEESLQRVFDLDGIVVYDRMHSDYGVHLKKEGSEDFFVAFDFDGLKLVFATFYTADINRYNDRNRFEVYKE